MGVGAAEIVAVVAIPKIAGRGVGVGDADGFGCGPLSDPNETVGCVTTSCLERNGTLSASGEMIPSAAITADTKRERTNSIHSILNDWWSSAKEYLCSRQP